VLDNIKLPSEKAELLIPFLRRIKRQYGDPIALVHDMGHGLMSAIGVVFPGCVILFAIFIFYATSARTCLQRIRSHPESTQNAQDPFHVAPADKGIKHAHRRG